VVPGQRDRYRAPAPITSLLNPRSGPTYRAAPAPLARSPFVPTENVRQRVVAEPGRHRLCPGGRRGRHSPEGRPPPFPPFFARFFCFAHSRTLASLQGERRQSP